MRGSVIQRYRRACAVAAALLWLLGVEVLPDAHLARHRADHTHAADGSIVADHHDHDADGNDIVHHPEPDLDHTGQLAIDHDAPQHVASGLAHHAVALHQPAPPVITLFVPRDLSWHLSTASAPLSSIPATSPAARGPPAHPRLESVLDA